MIVFLIPVCHHESVEDYEQIWGLLNNTLMSLAGQDCPKWHAMVCCSKMLPIAPELPRRQITFLTSTRRAGFDNHMKDKAARRLACVERVSKVGLRPAWYFMADADDYLATNVVSTILTTTERRHSIVTLDTGIVIDSQKQSYVTTDDFNDLCGTSVAIHASLVHSTIQSEPHIQTLLSEWRFPKLLAGKFCQYHNRHSMAGFPRAAYVLHDQNYSRHMWDYSELMAASKPLTNEIREHFTLPVG